MEIIFDNPAQLWAIVFVCLVTVGLCFIALGLLITLYKLVSSGKRKAEGRRAAAVPARAAGLDPGIIAAIMAAIAAASGQPASSLRLASVQASGFNTPVWGHVDRV